MSKRFLGYRTSSASDTGRNPTSFSRREQEQKDQVSRLYELGLLSKSDKRSRRREKDKDKDLPGGARVAGSHPKKDNRKNLVSTRGNSNTSSSTVLLQASKANRDLKQRAGRGMSGMLDTERTRNRRERTFVGSECAVCEEPLEHTLRGERILQFSCGHVSHEACFYEYIKESEAQYCPTCNAPLGLDTSRGGNVLDIGKTFRAVSASDQSARSTPTPTTWETQTDTHTRDNSRENGSNRDSRESRERMDRYGQPSRMSHQRNDSGNAPSSVGYPETAISGPPRRHDYDVQAMESNIMSPRASVSRNPIPAPVVSIRSEFPTLNRSRQQQTLTCLITIEVPDNKWRPDPDDIRSAPPLPNIRPEDTYARPPSPAQSAPRFYPYESSEVLDEITDGLRNRVDNWHGLDFNRFGKLRLLRNHSSWKRQTILAGIRMFLVRGNAYLRSILIKKHLNEVIESGSDNNILTLSLSVAELPSFHLKFDNRNQLKLWQQALLDLNAIEGSPARSPDYDLSEPEEEEWNRDSSGHSEHRSIRQLMEPNLDLSPLYRLNQLDRRVIEPMLSRAQTSQWIFLCKRRSNNPIATILLISDSSTSDAESVDFVVSRAEAAKIAVHSFGLGMTHKPDTMIELSTRTKASYTYVKDWMMLRECLAGCLGSLQTMSHQNRALQITKRATGKDAEASLGDLRFGDKRDILVQLVIAPDNASQEQLAQDPWDSIVSGLEALGGPVDQEDQRVVSIEEVPLIQADLTWGDILRDGTLTHLPRPSLLAITMLPAPTNQKKHTTWNSAHLFPSSKRCLGKGGLPPIPPPPSKSPSNNLSSRTGSSSPTNRTPERRRTPSPTSATTVTSNHTLGPIPRHQSNDALSAVVTAPGIDPNTVAALDAELEASLEWINHPAVFGRDNRKAVLQAIGVISSQRGYTFRSPVESLLAGRVSGIKRMTDRSREWREEGGSEDVQWYFGRRLHVGDSCGVRTWMGENLDIGMDLGKRSSDLHDVITIAIYFGLFPAVYV
ncbi:hypothetical protein EYC84_011940 [Monilinia fructicola]|uniref:RING-type domain-containing protein n=1 Tax=Monilinia fructicola TaxID=38448 RepID=A0A5M9J440_MONFR|nr:hypothetical protein EYC84_011940 [Monilinia fructicola]